MDEDKGKTVDERLNDYLNASEPKVEEQPAPMPSADQTTEPEVEEVSQDEASSNDSDVDEAEALANSKNPERTKSYIEKLKSEIQTLKQPKEEPPRDYGNSVYDSIHAPNVPVEQVPRIDTPYLNPQQAQNIKSQFVDEDGNVDVGGLNKALIDANQRAYDASQRVASMEQKIAQIEESQEVKETHARFPEMEPTRKDKFNPELYEAVRDRLVRNLWEGKKVPLVNVVESVQSTYFKTQAPEQVKAQAVEEYKKTQEARNQGPFETGRPKVSPTDYGELREQTRRGGQKGDEALSQRLKALGI